MAFVTPDRVKETSESTGVGLFTLGGAISGHRSFLSVLSIDDTFPYVIEGGPDWECGIGTFVLSGGIRVLDRTVVLASSNAGSRVDFLSGAKNVFIGYPGARAVTTEYRDQTTSTVPIQVTWRHNNTGSATPVAGFGIGHKWQLESSIIEDRDAFLQEVLWVAATDSSRKARVVRYVYDTAARETMREEASGTEAMIGFLGASAVVRQSSGANLTNSVTSGGTDDTITNYTDLSVYVNDAAAIRNNIYQLARKLKQVNDALRAYGLLT